MPFLKINNLSKEEKGNLIINNVSFTQERFNKIAIAGATGSGKTSLLKMIAGLLQPTSGEIFFNQQKVIGPLEQLIPHHPGIAYLSQHFELFNNYWVHEVLEMANKLPQQEAINIYAICQVDHLLNRRTNELSGGEKQRIALARLLTTSPKLLLLDEPFSNMDAVHKAIIKNVIEQIGVQLHITCVLVSHDALDILSWANEIIVLQQGSIIQQGMPQLVYSKPVNEYCAGLLGDYNLIDHSIMNGKNSTNKKLFIRPEQFEMATAESHSLQGILKHILFFGGYYMLRVLVGQQMLNIKSNHNNFTIDRLVYLSFNNNDVWLL